MGKYFVWLAFAGFTLYSCNNVDEYKGTRSKLGQNTILQQQDGTISLEVNKADTYHDLANPSTNTAEWSVVVSKSGRYDVWLSSATKDTTNLKYDNSVLLSFLDHRLEAYPGIDKVIHNSSDVLYPYFRTDSFMGSLFIQDTGLFNIQVISDKIIPEDQRNERSVLEETKLLSVSLTPTSASLVPTN